MTQSSGVYSNKKDRKRFNTEMVPSIIYACFVLQNSCESCGCSLDEEAVKAQMRWNQIEEDINKNIPDPIYSCTTGEGVAVRDTLTSFIGQIITHKWHRVQCILHIADHIPFFSAVIIFLEVAKSYGYSLDFLLIRVMFLYYNTCFWRWILAIPCEAFNEKLLSRWCKKLCVNGYVTG